jgi:hypothetical protein
MTIDTARLRALAEAAQSEMAVNATQMVARREDALFAFLNAAANPETVLALLDERDEMERERDDAREAARTWENEAERRSRRYEKCAAERDALAAMLRECRDFIEGVCATTFIRSQIANARELVNRIDKSSVSKE